MNNLFNAFKISVPGQLLDNKKFFEYADYDNESTDVPTDGETLNKAQAYIRMKHVERKLSELSVPVYFTITFGTEGTASSIPSDAEIVVGYVSINPFITQPTGLVPGGTTDYTTASDTIKAIIDEAISATLLSEFAEVQKTYTRSLFPGSSTTNTYRELETIYVTSIGAAPGTESEVVYIDLSA